MGDLRYAQRRMDAGLRGGEYGSRHEPADAELCARLDHRSFQRGRTAQTATGNADAQPGVKGWQALSMFWRAGRGYAGSEPAAVLPQYRRIRHDRAGIGGGGQYQYRPALAFPGRRAAGGQAATARTYPAGQ